MSFRALTLVSILILCCLASFCKGCVDVDSICHHYTSYCNSDQWVQQNCQQTCNLCSGGASWSACSKTCGGGTRYKQVNNAREYEACNMQACSTASCSYGYEQRKGMPHSCCSKTSSDINCGLNYDSRRVIFGQHANFREWPWAVALRYWNALGTNAVDLCGGALISNKHVLSAAHCFQNNPILSRWKAYTGILRLQEAPSSGGNGIQAIHKHPQYSFPANDIVVVELQNTVSSTASVYPVCLPRGEVTPEDTTCWVHGWGRSHHTNSFQSTDHLQEAALKNLNPWWCRNKLSQVPQLSYATSFLNTASSYLCAGGLNQQVDTCEGDSGSALVCQRCSSCTFYVAGIVSLGHPNCGTAGFPAVYTKVLHFESWIKGIIASWTSNLNSCTFQGGVP